MIDVSSRAAPITTARLRVEPSTLATQRRQGAYLVHVDNRDGDRRAAGPARRRRRVRSRPARLHTRRRWRSPPGQVGTARLAVDSEPPPGGESSSRRLRISASDGRARGRGRGRPHADDAGPSTGRQALARGARRDLRDRWGAVRVARAIDPDPSAVAATTGAAEGDQDLSRDRDRGLDRPRRPARAAHAPRAERLVGPGHPVRRPAHGAHRGGPADSPAHRRTGLSCCWAPCSGSSAACSRARAPASSPVARAPGTAADLLAEQERRGVGGRRHDEDAHLGGQERRRDEPAARDQVARRQQGVAEDQLAGREPARLRRREGAPARRRCPATTRAAPAPRAGTTDR